MSVLHKKFVMYNKIYRHFNPTKKKKRSKNKWNKSLVCKNNIIINNSKKTKRKTLDKFWIWMCIYVHSVLVIYY